MKICEEVGRWITENVVTPVEEFFQRAREVCSESRRWVEREIREPLETWVSQEEKRCREQECNWWCACCNKWLCIFVTVLVRVITWIIRIVGEWLVETICNLIVEIVRVIVMTIIQVTRWVVETIVCFVERFCDNLYLLAGVVLAWGLLGVVALGQLAALPAALPAFISAVAIAAAALLLARVLCESSMCRVVGVFVWAFKWGIVLGAAIAIGALSIPSAFIVVLFGGLNSALIWWLTDRGCRVPGLRGVP